MNELLCDATQDLIELSLDGELTAEEEARLQAHLAACPPCACEMALALRIRRELRALPAAAHVVPFPQLSARRGSLRLVLAAAMLALAVTGTIVLEQVRIRPAKPAPPNIAQATAEARYALAYVGKVGRRAGLDLRDGLLRRRLPLATGTDEP